MFRKMLWQDQSLPPSLAKSNFRSKEATNWVTWIQKRRENSILTFWFRPLKNTGPEFVSYLEMVCNIVLERQVKRRRAELAMGSKVGEIKLPNTLKLPSMGLPRGGRTQREGGENKGAMNQMTLSITIKYRGALVQRPWPVLAECLSPSPPCLMCH